MQEDPCNIYNTFSKVSFLLVVFKCARSLIATDSISARFIELSASTDNFPLNIH